MVNLLDLFWVSRLCKYYMCLTVRYLYYVKFETYIYIYFLKSTLLICVTVIQVYQSKRTKHNRFGLGTDLFHRQKHRRVQTITSGTHRGLSVKPHETCVLSTYMLHKQKDRNHITEDLNEHMRHTQVYQSSHNIKLALGTHMLHRKITGIILVYL